MLSSRITAGLGLGLLLSPSAAFAGAWTLEAGTGQAIVAGTLSGADRAFDGAGTLRDIPHYGKFELQGLFEYGATDWFTVMVAPSLQHVDIGPPVDAQRTGLGYFEAGGRARLAHWDSWVFSAQATLRVPGTFDTTNPAAIGHNGVEADLRALVGYSFALGAFPAFVDVQLAQRFRSAGMPHEFRADATFGIQPAPRWLVLLQSFNVISEGAGELSPSYEYYKLQASVAYAFTANWSAQVGGFSTIAGRNALQENGVLVGAWYRY